MSKVQRIKVSSREEWRRALDVAFRLGYKWSLEPFSLWEEYYYQNPNKVIEFDSKDMLIAIGRDEHMGGAATPASEFIESSLRELNKITSYSVLPNSKDEWDELVSAAIAEGFTWYSGGTDLKSFIYSAGTNYLDFWVDGSKDITYTYDRIKDNETLLVSAETVKWYLNQLSDEETTDLPVTKIDNDVVEHPAHYNEYTGFEVIDVIEQVSPKYEKQVAYHIGNTLKYIMRAPFKGKTKEDLEKAQWYLSRAISLLREEK